MEILIYFYKKMRTGSLICLLVQKCLCVSVSRGNTLFAKYWMFI